MTAREVIQVLNNKPHLLVRMEIRGEHFPHRAPHPFVHIKNGTNTYFHDYFSEVSPDNQKLIGYLPVDLPTEGIIEFGYGEEIWGSIPEKGSQSSIKRLDRKRLPRDLIIVDADFVKNRK